MSPLHFRRALAARLAHIAKAPLALALLALPACESEQKTKCIDWDSQLGACLSREEALAEFQLDQTCAEVHHSVDGDAVEQDGQCCYQVTVSDECCYGDGCPVEGRPLVVDGVSLLAPAVRGATAWPAALPDRRGAGGPVPTDAERAVLADMWLRAARQEHASIASFGRFALELLAFGAPPSLVTAAHVAAMDEIRHARACFALASRYAGEPVGPGAFPLPAALPIAADLAALAAGVVEEGCVGETIAALFAAEQRAAASDPEVCAALDAIVAEESEHAELAWAAVRWAVARGGAPVLRAVEQAFDRAARRIAAAQSEPQAPGVRAEVVAAHGRLPAGVFNQVAAQALAEVILPCARALSVASAGLDAGVATA
jgi:hypothetical protein